MNPRCVYLAARAGRRLELVDYARQLAALGYEVTSRWLFREGDRSDEALMTDAQRGELADECFDDIARSGVLIAFTEPSDSVWARGGRHVEFGFAHGLGEFRLMVVGPRENVFHCLSEVEQFDHWPDALAAMGEVPSVAPDGPPVEIVRGCGQHAPPDPTCPVCVAILAPMFEGEGLLS